MEIKENTKTYSFFDYTLIPSENILLRGDKTVSLRPKTFLLLVKLVENAGKLCEKETLISEIWSDVIIEEGNLNRTVSELRKILGDNSDENKYIQTVTRLGYRFIAEVEIKNSEPEFETENPQIEETQIPKIEEEKVVENKSTFFSWNIVGFTMISLLLFLGIGATIWKFQSFNKSKLTKFGEFQVTDSKNNEDSAFWTNDGKIRFISNLKEKPPAMMRINVDGSELIDEGNRISPDGKKTIIYDETEKISYVCNSDGSDKRKLPILVGNMDWSKVSNEIVVQFFPDGKREGSEIAIVNLETLQMTNITNTPNLFEADPSFSPDAQQILFTSTKDGNAEIYLMNRDGTNIKRLTNNPAWESFASFSPDGTQISYNSDRDKEKNNVYLMNMDGSGKEFSLPRDDYANYIGTGSWSPDGTKLVYSSDRNGNEDIFTIDAEFNKPIPYFSENASISFFAISPDGNLLVYLVEIAKDKFEIRTFDKIANQTKKLREINNLTNLSFSPDGKTIAFQERIEGNTEICLIDIDGTNFRNISNNSALDIGANFSADGSKLLFLSSREKNGILDIYTMNADGTNQQKFYADAGTNNAVTWSADGDEIYFSNDKEDGRNGNFEIFKVSADGKGEVTRLTNRPRYLDENPSISPNGKKIVFESLQKGNYEIYSMNTDGTGLLRLTRNLAEDRNPIWSNDGNKLYFTSNRNGKFEIFEINLN